ncbi:MAG TPA: OmpH family outer membrane protein [Bacteroidia bacterium]|jgi:outer membrane protein|nr:OmpH family outer membrane protein [Bacteroidia bacterium]
MKTNIKKAALTLFTIGTITICNAQKVGHIHLDSLVSMMPETKTAKEVAQSYWKDLEKTVVNMDNEFQAKYSDYMAGQANMSDLIKKTKEEELQSLQKRIEDFKQQAQQEYQKKSAELTAPIMNKAKKGVEAVAKEGGFKYIIDTSTGNVLYSEAADDVLMLVKKKLDAMPLATIPGAGAAAEKAKTGAEKPKTPPKTGGK